MNKCHICNQDAFFTCRQCGKPVCNQHHSFDNGKCAECNGTWKKPEKPAAIPQAEFPQLNTITKRQKARR